MARRYCAFMVRCWSLGDGSQRAEIECIPTGEKVLVGSLAQAVGWMDARIANPAKTLADAPGDARSTGAPPPRDGEN